MSAITITDLNNAKLDVDHIAAIATSTANTATDRLNNTKNTIYHAMALIDADVVSVDDSRIAAQTAMNADIASVAYLADTVAGVVSAVSPNVYYFSGNDVDTDFQLTNSPGVVENTNVHISGAPQYKNTYSLQGASLDILRFTTAPPAGVGNIQVEIGPSVQLQIGDAAGVNYVPAGAGAVPRDMRTRERESYRVTDYTSAQAAIDIAPAGSLIWWPAGTYNYTTKLIVNKPLTFMGDSMGGSILSFTGCDGIYITHDGNALTGNAIWNMSIVTTDSGLYKGIEFIGTEISGGFKIPRITLENVNVSGASVAGSSLNEWLYGVKITSGDQGCINNLCIKGKETAYSSGYLPATYGLHLTDTTILHARALAIYRVKTGALITGQSEGCTFEGEIVAVDTGVLMTGLVVPSNNHNINLKHISATRRAVQIDQTTTSTNTLAHTFGDMFVLKRDQTGVGGADNYMAFDLAVDKCSFSGIVCQSSYASKDYYTTGDRAFSFRNGSTNNMLSGITLQNPGVGIEYLDTCKDNHAAPVTVINTTGYTMYPTTEVAHSNYSTILYDTGNPPNGAYVRTANGHDFNTSGGLAFRVNNGATDTDTYIDTYGDTEANAMATLRANGEVATNVDLRLLALGAGKIRFGSLTANADAPVTGYITIKDTGGTLRKLAVIA